MRSKPCFQFEKRGFMFFALTSMRPLIFVYIGDSSIDKGKTKPRALDAGW
jgi:hypothetical protein